MSLYILDTDILSLLRKGHPLVVARVASQSTTDLAITIISVEEMLTGWYTYLRLAKKPAGVVRAYQELGDSFRFLSRWTILPHTDAAQNRYATLQSLKPPLGKMDLRIASIVLENSAILVTRNLADFQRVPGLTIENWPV
jgi:tRNA(fMet)-specific endonuclease VapC